MLKYVAIFYKKMNLARLKSLTKRSQKAHKGSHGFVLAIGGSEDYVGTLILLGLAALRSGCDLVTVAAPEKVAWAINCYSADLITKKLPGKYLTAKHIKLIKRILSKFDVITIGNGIGLKPETKQFCKQLMKLAKNKLKVVDADAIKLLSLKEINNAIITPHSRELQLLLKNSNLNYINKIKDNNIKNKNKKFKLIQKHLNNNILLIKGNVDYIVSKNKIKKVSGGNPGLIRAGSGDVLAGLCAGFLAQTKNLFVSAQAASFVQKQVGNILLKKHKGYSFIASDIVDEIKSHRLRSR